MGRKKVILDCCESCACDPGSSWVHVTEYNKIKKQAENGKKRGIQLLALLCGVEAAINEMEVGRNGSAMNLIIAAMEAGERLMEKHTNETH